MRTPRLTATGFVVPKPRRSALYYLKIVLAIFTAIVVLAVAAVAIVDIIFNSTQNATWTICVRFTAEELGSGSNGVMIGAITLNYNSRSISWDLQYRDFDSVPTALQLRGPIPAGQQFGPVALTLCGAPSSFACDTTVAGKLKGTVLQNGVTGGSLKPVIQAIREAQWRYRGRVITGAHAAGEVSGSLGTLCGTP